VRPPPSIGQPATFRGFYVESLDEASTRLTEVGAVIFQEHQVRPWGCPIVAEDPDGRAIEISQHGHCVAEKHVKLGMPGPNPGPDIDIDLCRAWRVEVDAPQVVAADGVEHGVDKPGPGEVPLMLGHVG